MRFLICVFTLVKAVPTGKDDYPSYEICKYFQEDKIDEMYEALGLNNQWPRLEKDPKADFRYENDFLMIINYSVGTYW